MAAGAECDSRNLVGVMCSYDMGWKKKGKAHNSSTGHGAVLGVAAGKVLDLLLGIKPVEPVLHQKKITSARHTTAGKNYCGSSKIIESNVACELFKRAPARGVKYDKYIGDDDSTTFSHLKTNVPYGLEKNSDFVHTKRS